LTTNPKHVEKLLKAA